MSCRWFILTENMKLNIPSGQMKYASILTAWLGGFTLVYTSGVIQNSYKGKKNSTFAHFVRESVIT